MHERIEEKLDDRPMMVSVICVQNWVHSTQSSHTFTQAMTLSSIVGVVEKKSFVLN